MNRSHLVDDSESRRDCITSMYSGSWGLPRKTQVRVSLQEGECSDELDAGAADNDDVIPENLG